MLVSTTPALMQDHPLMISSLIEHAALNHPKQEIVTRTVEGSIHRTNYAQLHDRSKQVAKALARLGVKPGERVATLAWNTVRHLELYFGVSGSGVVLHTVNPRLFLEQIEYIVNHAENQVLLFDITFAEIVERLAPKLPTVKHYIAMTDRDHMPAINVPNLLCYEEWISTETPVYTWPVFDERSASTLCYTSGTTGNPKGVLYSHRSTVLHALKAAASDVSNMSYDDVLLLIVPLFHCNAWGSPYVAAMLGNKLVLPGMKMDGASILELIQSEKVTLSQAVPTVWLMLIEHLRQHPEINPRALGLKRVGLGGSAPSEFLIRKIEEEFGAQFSQGWGMTETSPLGVQNHPLPNVPRDMNQKLKAGRSIWGLQVKVVDSQGNELPRDGKSSGKLLVKGHWVASAYFKRDELEPLDSEGWFDTGDVANIDEYGFMQLVDREKDVIKSGGEWISSIDVENAVTSHPAVQQAAVIGVPHLHWQERPLLLAVLRDGQTTNKEELMTFLSERIAKWWLPDDIVFVDDLPLTATGKLYKLKLREQYKDHLTNSVS